MNERQILAGEPVLWETMMKAKSVFRLQVIQWAVAGSILALMVVGQGWAEDAKAPDAPAAAAPPAPLVQAAPAPAPAPVAQAAPAPGPDIVPPTDPVARAAFNVLEKNCSRCHQVGKLISRERPAKNFGNILKLDELAVNPHYILPGNPLGSKLFRQIADKEMPYDVNYEGETKYGTVSEADLKALEDWITSLGTTATASCESHKLITPEAMVRFMAADIDSLSRSRRENTRYLTLTHFANICVDAAAMKVYRQGAIKFINSVSRSSDMAKLETVDPEATILRINLTDIGWSAADWDRLLAIYPYNAQPDLQLNSVLSDATHTPLPYLRADWLTDTASQPPLYYDILGLPNTFKKLAQLEGVDVEGDIRNFVAQRAGFQKSGVSANNRLIERHPSHKGYFWTSYDFAGNRANQSLFEFPLGPSAEGFHHDGGETIFSLPNGLQGYFLNKATGERLDKGPTAIVRDLSNKDLTVTNGISCMGCHDQGMRKAKDEVRDLVLTGHSFPREVREAVEGLYPPKDKMDALIDGDARRFAEAMARAGLEPTLKLNGVEMINALAKRYEEDIDLTSAAAELGIDKKMFKEASVDADKDLRSLVRRLEQGSVPREQFEQSFVKLAESITDLKAVYVAGAVAYNAKPVLVVNRDDLSLTSDADYYHLGDSPVFTIISPTDCYLTLTDVDDKGAGTVLLPNKFQQDNRIKAGVAFQFPGANAPFKYSMKDRGTETVVAVCARQAGSDGVQHDFNKNAFTVVSDYNATIARSIAVLPATPAGAPGAPRPQTVSDAPRASFRAAIKLVVR
jgi:hypothetical protein